MENDKPIDPKTVDLKAELELMKSISKGNPGAIKVLSAIRKALPDTWLTAIIDIKDMQLFGSDLWVAYNEACAMNVYRLIESLRTRDPVMLSVVKAQDPDSPARLHGPQYLRNPTLDGAVSSILKTAEEEGRLRRLDEGAEAVNYFFINLLIEMQRAKNFSVNFKVNLNAEGGEWGVFVIAFAEMQNRDGTPIKSQPQDENQRVNELEAQKRPPWQSRVLNEHSELAKRISALTAFIEAPDFEKLDYEESADLVDQRYAMIKYEEVLASRIKRFSKEQK